MKEKEFVCGYNHCLHSGEKVKESEAVMVGKKRYHMDCAELKQKIDECVNLYMENIEDKTQYPMAVRIINSLVFNNGIPVDYVLKKINSSGTYYKDKPAYVLYGIRKIFYKTEFPPCEPAVMYVHTKTRH